VRQTFAAPIVEADGLSAAEVTVRIKKPHSLRRSRTIIQKIKIE
jgi:hypothetical protein